MSEGPIKRERDAWLPAPASTHPGTAVHLAKTIVSSYCGRKAQRGGLTTNRDEVTCSDCAAALRADGAVQ